MGAIQIEMKQCPRCGKTMRLINFYTCRNGKHIDLCKKCLTAKVDNFKPETFEWILQKIDVPYIPSQWNSLRDAAFNKDPRKMNGMSVIGKYLSKMRLGQWSQYGYDQSAEACEKAGELGGDKWAEEKEQFEQELKEKYGRGDISEVEYQTYISSEVLNEEYQNAPPPTQEEAIGENNLYKEENYMDASELPDLASQLTKEDKIVLAMKWGIAYTPDEWISLERKYNEMMESFDIQDSDSKSALILICKTYLKMNQAIDEGDFESYQKLSRTYESLRKSAKFTAVQNKEKESGQIDCVGNLVAYCEAHGGKIPRFKLDVDYDVVDAVINDMKKYNRDLVYQDTALARQVEAYLKKRERRDLAKIGLAAKELVREWARHPNAIEEEYYDAVLALDAVLQRKSVEEEQAIAQDVPIEEIETEEES